MSIDLSVTNSISTTAQQISDQAGNASALYISTTTANLQPTSKLMFGVVNDPAGGQGEWIQNTRGTSANQFGISLFVSSREQFRVTASNATFPNLQAGNGVDVVADASGNLFKQSSSARFKEAITTFRDDFAKVLSLQPVSFRYKDSGHTSVGYLAEDVHEQELPSLVSYDDEGRPESVHYKLLSVYLLEIVKTQQSALSALREQVDRMAAVVLA